jgi:uncharacterized membrane protein
MRTLMRGVGLSVALIVAAAIPLAACQRQAPEQTESTTGPTDEEREAAMAAEQLTALGGPASAEQQALYTGDFQASGALDNSGEEGAWELQLLDGYAQFTRPGLGEDSGIPGPRDFHEHGVRAVAGPLTITIRQEACTASGVELQYKANVLFEGVNYEGCARRGIDQGSRATWASVLPELIPAIDACMGHVNSRPARVTFASSIDEGQTSVRIREADGLRRDCIVDANGAVTLYEPVSDIDRRSGEGDPEFQRGTAQPRAQNCRTAEAANDRSGAQLGWLIHHSC